MVINMLRGWELDDGDILKEFYWMSVQKLQASLARRLNVGEGRYQRVPSLHDFGRSI
jgi:hypothetical protein